MDTILDLCFHLFESLNKPMKDHSCMNNCLHGKPVVFIKFILPSFDIGDSNKILKLHINFIFKDVVHFSVCEQTCSLRSLDLLFHTFL